MRPRFGTDGVRGVANVDLTPELVVALGRAVARVLRPGEVVVGRDTRRSGPLLQAALSAGLAAEGVDVVDVGMVPTPAVAFFAEHGGAVVSASHNPFQDNGIKVFGAGGRKLSADIEDALEAELDRLLAAPVGAGPAGDAVGAVCERLDHARYVQHLTASLDGRDLSGLQVVVDGANGAASFIAPAVLAQLGASVTTIHAEPDGTNINAGCGSTHPADLQRAVVDHGADAGLAFDGDADRVVAVDARGQLIDGDHLLAIFALDQRERGRLVDDTVVVTVMTNLGFRLAMQEQGLKVIETPVGDRHVLAALADGGWSLGGEQSGHIIFPELATTGDGLLTGLQLLDVMARSGRPLTDLADVMERLPQVLLNVRVERAGDDLLGGLAPLVAEVEAGLGERGRVLVRTSGTEPLVRVMVEAPTHEQAQAIAERVAGAIRDTSALS